jgi:hypothetical protein
MGGRSGIMIWKAVPGLPGYEVSNSGSLRNVTTCKVLKLHRLKGYACVTIKGRRQRVHRLVAAAFLGPRPDGQEVNHLDSVRDHNEPHNLEYVTRSGNMMHAGRAGRLGKAQLRGSANGQAKLSDARMLLLEQLYYLREWTSAELGVAFSVSSSRVRKITTRKFGVQEMAL